MTGKRNIEQTQVIGFRERKRRKCYDDRIEEINSAEKYNSSFFSEIPIEIWENHILIHLTFRDIASLRSACKRFRFDIIQNYWIQQIPYDRLRKEKKYYQKLTDIANINHSIYANEWIRFFNEKVTYVFVSPQTKDFDKLLKDGKFFFQKFPPSVTIFDVSRGYVSYKNIFKRFVISHGSEKIEQMNNIKQIYCGNFEYEEYTWIFRIIKDNPNVEFYTRRSYVYSGLGYWGRTDYIIRPLSFDLLLRRVTSFIEYTKLPKRSNEIKNRFDGEMFFLTTGYDNADMMHFYGNCISLAIAKAFHDDVQNKYPHVDVYRTPPPEFLTLAQKAELLLEEGADPNAGCHIKMKRNYRYYALGYKETLNFYSCLEFAIGIGNIELVITLIKYGAIITDSVRKLLSLMRAEFPHLIEFELQMENKFEKT